MSAVGVSAEPLRGWRLETVRTTGGETGEKWVRYWGNGPIVHTTLAATVGDVACGARPDWNLPKLKRVFGELLDVPFERYIRDSPGLAKHLPRQLNVRLLVVGLRRKQDGYFRPILDGRHRVDLLREGVRDCVILLGAAGDYLGVVPEPHNLLPLACHCDLTSWQRKCRPLKELLGLSTDRPEPRTLGELKEFFAAVKLEGLSCQIDFVLFVQGQRQAWYSESLTFGDSSRRLFVQARAGADHGLVYRLQSCRYWGYLNN